VADPTTPLHSMIQSIWLVHSDTFPYPLFLAFLFLVFLHCIHCLHHCLSFCFLISFIVAFSVSFKNRLSPRAAIVASIFYQYWGLISTPCLLTDSFFLSLFHQMISQGEKPASIITQAEIFFLPTHTYNSM